MEGHIAIVAARSLFLLRKIKEAQSEVSAKTSLSLAKTCDEQKEVKPEQTDEVSLKKIRSD